MAEAPNSSLIFRVLALCIFVILVIATISWSLRNSDDGVPTAPGPISPNVSSSPLPNA